MMLSIHSMTFETLVNNLGRFDLDASPEIA